MAIRNYKSGFAVTDTPTDLICLQCSPTASTSKSLLQNDTTNYQVPAGKTLYITKIIVHGEAANWTAAVEYADAADGVTNKRNVGGDLMSGVSAYEVFKSDVWIPIPESKYPCVTPNAAGRVRCTVFAILITN